MRARQVAQTRREILDALAAEIIESGMLGLSMQRVADRAGVTHRTLYNHFPTREALSDAFAVHVEEVLAELGAHAPETETDLAGFPAMAGRFHELLGAHAPHIRAYVMMTMATGAPAQVFRNRSKKFQKLIEGELGPLEPGVARLVTSAIRLFVSSAGWHLLTEHHGLTGEESGRVSEWAVRVLLDAVRTGDVPNQREDDSG